MRSIKPSRVAGQRAGLDEVIALIRKIDRGLQPRDQIEECGIDLADRLRERALKLIERRARLQRRNGINQIADGFRLNEIDAAVQKRPQRELARLGQPRARAHRRFQDGPQHDRAPVRAQLHHIVSRVRRRSREVCRDHLIDRIGPRPVSATPIALGCSQPDCRCAPRLAESPESTMIATLALRAEALRVRACTVAGF